MNRRSFLKGVFALSALAFLPPLPMAPPEVQKTFEQLLREYLPLDLLREELQKKSYLLARIPKDDVWQGSTISIPFNVPIVEIIK